MKYVDFQMDAFRIAVPFMEAHPEHNGQGHWESRVQRIAGLAEELTDSAERARKKGEVPATIRDRLIRARDLLNEALGKYMEGAEVEECELEDELMDLFNRMKAILEKERKPKQTGRPFARMRYQQGEALSGRIAHLWKGR